MLDMMAQGSDEVRAKVQEKSREMSNSQGVCSSSLWSSHTAFNTLTRVIKPYAMMRPSSKERWI